MTGIETKGIEWSDAAPKPKMYPDEAMLVYLYLKDQPPGTRDEEALRHAWSVICEHAQTNIKAFRR